MIKLFVATIFIAELVIAWALISKIRQVNKSVNQINTLVLYFKPKIGFCMLDIREFFEFINEKIGFLFLLIRKKRQEYLLKFLKTSLIYTSILFLKGKYKKAVLLYQLMSEIIEGVKEANS